MVAVITTGHSIRRIFNYNENKVSAGTAQCIGEGNYPAEVEKMNNAFKLGLLLRQLELNENVKRNSVHISLNFDPSEKELPVEKLMQIASRYMLEIGFGSQPYLVYQHHDAGHPHIHIVSIKVKADGRRIDMQNIGRDKSEKARKEIEDFFGLVKAESKKIREEFPLDQIMAAKIHYGKTASKNAVSNVLNYVVNQYHYCSLPELNAVLNLFNVAAERGSEESRTFKHNGLLYRMLDNTGKPIGVPIKASNFYSRPTLKNLEQKFRHNKDKKEPHKKLLRNSIDLLILRKNPCSITEFSKLLEKEGIIAVFRTNNQGILYGITYVDHRTKSVFNGSSLGKQYSAKSIVDRCLDQNSGRGYHYSHDLEPQVRSEDLKTVLEKMAENLLQTEHVSNFLPYQLKRKKKNRKRI